MHHKDNIVLIDDRQKLIDKYLESKARYTNISDGKVNPFTLRFDNEPDENGIVGVIPIAKG